LAFDGAVEAAMKKSYFLPGLDSRGQSTRLANLGGTLIPGSPAEFGGFLPRDRIGSKNESASR
jgi:hypothetical protein